MKNVLFSAILASATKGSFPATRKWVWRQIYNLMSAFWNDSDWRFMNYGYMPNDTPQFFLELEDEKDRAFIGLYQQAVDGLDLDGKRVLEVGCGRGGGASYISRYYAPKEMVGIDYSPKTVQIAKKLNKVGNDLVFQIGDAENLPFENDAFDIILNIESSHCYANMDAFVREVERTLKPGGLFSWADLRGPSMMENTDAAFSTTKLTILSEKSLAEGVVPALDHTSESKTDIIKRFPMFKRFMNEFAATKGTRLYNGIKSGKVLYLARRYQK
ncbi:MAG: class I SAM-dependent methyltransferase [Rhizobiaceae bacterium]|nr:class I SAM-dependent methyltransferase [Rhizobiaceae bacterium]